MSINANRCGDCAFWTPKEHDPRWGTCNKALNGGMFMNRAHGTRYMARHTNSRYYNQQACKVRFVRRDSVAEFQKVMGQWRRFCKSHSNCGECEFDGKGICGEAHLSDVPYSDIESAIMTWAEKHPEPTTVYEWLVSLGLLSADMWSIADLHKPIPADIAKKLRNEPGGKHQW